jgi:hypothetical protein
MTLAMNRAGYFSTISKFLITDSDTIIGLLTRHNGFAVEDAQLRAWVEQIAHLQSVLSLLSQDLQAGSIHFEYAIPRMGRRIDVVLILGGLVLVLEYKVGEVDFTAHAHDQAIDYALDLKHFHEASHYAIIVPMVIATEAPHSQPLSLCAERNDGIINVLKLNKAGLASAIDALLAQFPTQTLDSAQWVAGRYHPTPTIVEAARALYAGHEVTELARSDAGAANLGITTTRLEDVWTSPRSVDTLLSAIARTGCHHGTTQIPTEAGRQAAQL